MFLVQDFISSKDYDDIYYAYTNFFADLYGTVRDDAKEAIKQVNEEHILKALVLYNKDREIIAIARFKVLGKELLTSDIVTVSKETSNRKKFIYEAMITRLEEEAEKLGLDISFLEVPKFDVIFQYVAESCGYRLEPESENDKKSKYIRTLLMHKKLRELESEQFYGRYRINKQTQKSDK